jgi:hypothetical protein
MVKLHSKIGNAVVTRLTAKKADDAQPYFRPLKIIKRQLLS